MTLSKQLFKKESEPYYWDGFYTKFKSGYRKLINQLPDIKERGFIMYSVIVHLNSDISKRHVKLARHLGKTLGLHMFVGTTFNYQGIAIITLKVAGYEEMIVFFKNTLLDVINNEQITRQQLVEDYKFWKKRINWHYPKLYPLIPNVKACAREAHMMEYKYCNKYLKDVLARQREMPNFKVLKTMQAETQNWVDNMRIKDYPLTIKNYERCKSDFTENQVSG